MIRPLLCWLGLFVLFWIAGRLIGPLGLVPSVVAIVVAFGLAAWLPSVGPFRFPERSRQ